MKSHSYLVIFAGLICGLLLPEAGHYSAFIPLMVGILIFFSFLSIKIEVHRIFRMELLIPGFLSTIVMPVSAYYLFSRSFESPYRIGMLLTACAPTGVMTIVLSQYVRNSDQGLALSNFLVSTLGSILYIPIVLKCILGKNLMIEIQPIMRQIAILLIVPYLASRLVIRLSDYIQPSQFKLISNVLILFVLFVVLTISTGKASLQLKWDVSLLGISVWIFGIYFIQGILGYLAGYIFGNKGIKNTLAFICSSRNSTVALAVAVLNFSPLASVPIIISFFIHHLTNGFWLWLFREK